MIIIYGIREFNNGNHQHQHPQILLLPQRERDILSMAFQVSESNADRANSIILQKMAGDNNIDVAELQAKIGAAQSKGNFLAEMFKKIIPLPI